MAVVRHKRIVALATASATTRAGPPVASESISQRSMSLPLPTSLVDELFEPLQVVIGQFRGRDVQDGRHGIRGGSPEECLA